jgi:hypothetical protein
MTTFLRGVLPTDYRDQVNGPLTGRHAGANFEETVCVLAVEATHSPLGSLAQTRRASMHGWEPMSRVGLLGTLADNRLSWPPVSTRCYRKSPDYTDDLQHVLTIGEGRIRGGGRSIEIGLHSLIWAHRRVRWVTSPLTRTSVDRTATPRCARCVPVRKSATPTSAKPERRRPR